MIETIIESYVNGQFGQMLEQIREHTWYDTTTDLQASELISDADALNLMCIAVRLDKR